MLIGLKLKNVRGISEVSIDFKSNIMGIYGEDGIGKSTVLDVLKAVRDDYVVFFVRILSCLC